MALVERENTRGPLAQKALRQAIRRTVQNKPRFADNSGLEGPKEKKQLRTAVQKRYDRLNDKVLPEGEIRDRYQNRLSFLRMTPKQQERQRDRFQEQKEERQEDRQERRDLREYLGSDETYQSQDAMFDKIWQDYLQSFGLQQSRVNEDFELATKRMGKERDRARGVITEDFGSRGILHSGLFNQELGEYDEAYTERLGDLSRDRVRSLEDLMEQRRLFQTENQMRQQEARLEAIRRRAAQQGIGLSQPEPKPLMDSTQPQKKSSPTKKKSQPAKKSQAAKKAQAPKKPKGQGSKPGKTPFSRKKRRR